MDERLALDRIQRIGQQVRAESRWYAVFCLVIAIAAFAYVVIVHLDGAGSSAVVLLFAVGFALLGGIWWRYGRNQRAVSHAQTHLDLPMGVASIALMAAALLIRANLLPSGFSVWLILVALLPALPCLFGTWKVLRG